MERLNPGRIIAIIRVASCNIRSVLRWKVYTRGFGSSDVPHNIAGGPYPSRGQCRCAGDPVLSSDGAGAPAANRTSPGAQARAGAPDAATSFLTLVAYLFAISVLLPTVSYLTRMDRFIFLSTLMVFSALVYAAHSAVLVKNGKKTLAEKVDRWSRILFPAALAIILVSSFVL